MKKSLVSLSLAAAFLLESVALAGTCQVKNADKPDRWRFVIVYDVDNGEVVLRQAINGGDQREVVVSGERVRVDHKYPGGTKYKAGAVATCKDGNILAF